jgi:hypothetical protein
LQIPKTREAREAWIRSASYADLYRLWLSAPLGHPFFKGELGEIYQEEMYNKIQEEEFMAEVAGVPPGRIHIKKEVIRLWHEENQRKKTTGNG